MRSGCVGTEVSSVPAKLGLLTEIIEGSCWGFYASAVSRLPASFLKCLVALGAPTPEGEVLWTATGFWYAYVPPEEPGTGVIYLVTNRHVVEDVPSLYLRLNPAVQRHRARPYSCPLMNSKGKPLWKGHPNPEVDLAVLPFDFARLRTEERLSELIFHGVDSAYRLEEMKLLVSEGDDVFILGFPLGAVGSFRNAVVVRKGCLAQVQELFSGHSDCYLVDAEVFPGNSGGPVVLAPEALHASDQLPVRPALIGVAFAYLAYQDVATSGQTGHARVLFEENSGLTQVYPVDLIDETIRAHLSGERRSRARKSRKAKQSEKFQHSPLD